MGVYALKVEGIPIGYAPVSQGPRGSDDLDGGVFTVGISQGQLATCRQETPGLPPFVLGIRDDGSASEGIWLEIRHVGDPDPTVEFFVPDKSISTLVHALQSVLRLREVE